jgi:SAM-dependent methyltransferase
MAVEVEIDVDLLKSEIKKTYASVSDEPEKDFIFPTGRAWAEDLGYPEELAKVPEAAAESFAGVANPWAMGRLTPGERVLDLGSGAGTDSLIAAQMVGEQGHVTGIDMTHEMLARAQATTRTAASRRVGERGSCKASTEGPHARGRRRGGRGRCRALTLARAARLPYPGNISTLILPSGGPKPLWRFSRWLRSASQS